LNLIQTTATKKIRRLRKRKRVVFGGQGASKTVGILQVLIDKAVVYQSLSVSVFQHELTKMRKTVIRDFIAIMQAAEIWNRDSWINGTTYTFDNGSYIEFVGLDKDDIGKGFRRDIVYFNEANRGIAYNTYQAIESRAKIIYIDFNPDAEFWVHSEVIGQQDVDVLQLTYKDNEALSGTERQAILSYYDKGYNADGSIKNEYWANKWRVYGLGELGVTEGLIFRNYSIIDTMPDMDAFKYGMDYGFSSDPTTCVKVGIKENKIYVQEMLWLFGHTNGQIISKMNDAGISKTDLIVGDSAEPKTIQDIANAGYNIVGSVKGEDSVRHGINKLLEYELYIVKGSDNLINEFKNYSWKQNTDGKYLPIPIDKFNHGIDALRYSQSVSDNFVCFSF